MKESVGASIRASYTGFGFSAEAGYSHQNDQSASMSELS
jgi:hypothetical protein